MLFHSEIEAREYTYCSAVYENPLRWEKFLVPAVKIAEASAQAERFAADQWGEPEHIHYYPRNYVKKARDLFALGRFPGGTVTANTRNVWDLR